MGISELKEANVRSNMAVPMSPYYLPFPSCHVLLHPVLGELLGLHVLGVFHQPWMLKALGTIQAVSDGAEIRGLLSRRGP